MVFVEEGLSKVAVLSSFYIMKEGRCIIIVSEVIERNDLMTVIFLLLPFILHNRYKVWPLGSLEQTLKFSMIANTVMIGP